MAGINPATGQWDPNYGDNPGYTGNPSPPPTKTSTETRQVGNYLVTYQNWSDGRQTVIKKVQNQGQPAGTPATTTPPPAAAVPGTTDTTGQANDAPPNGANPDELELKYDDKGNVIALVYKYTANGHNKGDVSKNYQQFQDWIAGIGEVPTARQATDLTTTQAYTDLQALIAKINDPNITAQDYENSLGILAKIAGVGTTSADWQNFMAGLNSQLSNLGQYLNQETPEQAAQTSQYLYAQRTDTEALMRKQTDAILSGATGNSMNAAIMQSNEMIRNLNNSQVEAQVQLANFHLSANVNAFNAKLTQYNEMFQNGSMTAQAIVKDFQNNRLAALQGYALELQTIQNQNSNIFTENEQALAAWKANADNIYTKINTELGIDASATAKIKADWDQWYAEGQAALQEQITKNQKGVGVFETCLGFIGLALSFIPGMAWLAAPSVGLVGSGLGNLTGNLTG
jgi:hypothetical protein